MKAISCKADGAACPNKDELIAQATESSQALQDNESAVVADTEALGIALEQKNEQQELLDERDAVVEMKENIIDLYKRQLYAA